jgi:predicted dehydrogenase
MNGDRIRLLQVGVGGWGASWLHALATLRDEAQLVALVDHAPEALDAAGSVVDVTPGARFTDVDAALAANSADMALVVVPPEAHRDVASACLDAGLPVLVEKPLAGRWEDCLALAETATRAGRELAVSQNYRYRPVVETARAVVASGRIGAVGQAQVEFRLHHDFRGTFRETMEHPLLLDMAVHHFDLIRYITGLEPRSVVAQTWNPPWSQFAGNASAICLFTMEGEVHVVYTAYWHPRGQVTDWNCLWRIEGARGYLVLDRDEVRVYEGDDPHTPGTAREEQRVPLVAMSHTDQAAVLMDFATAVQAGRPAPTTARDNLRSIQMVFAAVESATRGAPVTLDGLGESALRAAEDGEIR